MIKLGSLVCVTEFARLPVDPGYIVDEANGPLAELVDFDDCSSCFVENLVDPLFVIVSSIDK